MQIKIQQFASKCNRGIVEAGKTFGENPNEWGNEHETNEEIRRKRKTPAIESRINGGNICNIYRWYTAKSSTYPNNQQTYQAELNYLNIKCRRIQLALNYQRQYTPSIMMNNRNVTISYPSAIMGI